MTLGFGSPGAVSKHHRCSFETAREEASFRELALIRPGAQLLLRIESMTSTTYFWLNPAMNDQTSNLA